jgi:hypothetical protein
MAYHISTQNESKLKIAKQSYKGFKLIKSCSKLQKLPFKTKVAHKTKSCQKVAEQLVETPSGARPQNLGGGTFEGQTHILGGAR